MTEAHLLKCVHFDLCNELGLRRFHVGTKCPVDNKSLCDFYYSFANPDAMLDDNLIIEIIGTLTITEGFVPTAIRSEVMRLREKLTKELRQQER